MYTITYVCVAFKYLFVLRIKSSKRNCKHNFSMVIYIQLAAKLATTLWNMCQTFHSINVFLGLSCSSRRNADLNISNKKLGETCLEEKKLARKSLWKFDDVRIMVEITDGAAGHSSRFFNERIQVKQFEKYDNLSRNSDSFMSYMEEDTLTQPAVLSG